MYIYIMIRWQCNLCNIELPDDELIDVRKERHRTFHVDESIGTDKRQRNWTFGRVIWRKIKGYDMMINLDSPHIFKEIDGDDI